jgi:beta-lactamase class A
MNGNPSSRRRPAGGLVLLLGVIGLVGPLLAAPPAEAVWRTWPRFWSAPAPGAVPADGQPDGGPAPDEALPELAPTDEPPAALPVGVTLEDVLRERLAQTDGRWSLWFEDLRTGEQLGIEPERSYDAASLMKILVMMKVLRDVEDGRYTLDTEVHVRDTFPSTVPGAGTFSCRAKSTELTRAIGNRMSVRDLLHWMIVDSDNLATNVLMEVGGGPEAVREHARLYGVARSRVERYLLDRPAMRQGRVNRARADEYGQLLARIWRGEVVSPQASRTMIQVMSGLERWWIAARLPKQVGAAHKTGAVDGLRHDVGIFYTPQGHAFVLCVLGDRIPHTRAGLKAAHGTIADLAALVWSHVRTNPEPRAPLAGASQAPALVAATWYEQAQALTDRDTLRKAFAAAGYAPPRGAMALVAPILPGIEQPAFAFYSLGDTAFDHSKGRFHPASAIKVSAAVAALVTLGRHGATGQATVTMETEDGRFSGTVAALVDATFVHSSNTGYNRLMAIAGYDEANHQYFTAETGYPNLVMHAAYGEGRTRDALYVSPEIAWQDGGRSGVLPARTGAGMDPVCGPSTCTTLFELGDVIRRVVLHPELPPEDRFPVADADAAMLADTLARTFKRLRHATAEALGHPTKIWNKVGYIPRMQLLEAALVQDTVTGDRYLLSVLVPYSGPKEEMPTAEALLRDLARQTLRAVRDRPHPGPLLQREAGLPIDLRLRPTPGAARVLTIEARARGAESLVAWVGRTALPAPQQPQPGLFRWTHRFADDGPYTLVFRAERSGTAGGYRAVTIRFPAPAQAAVEID